MKRSTINSYIRDAESLFAEAGFYLPEWAHWTVDQWRSERERIGAIVRAGLGWDLTDFGLDDFEHTGLLLFTVRNGVLADKESIPYAEKLMVVRDRQVTPMHFHWSKTEDIINRSGGELVLKLFLADHETEQTTEHPFTVHRDGLEIAGSPGMEVRLKPGQSITLPPYLYHSFWAENGTCVVGEVSAVNDDATDNRFLDDVGRFPSIEEDEPPYRLLCTEYAGLF
ncbi:MAG: D-lyxose/D-mannose family sugar isomerase [Alkalispirochaeta sp.]